MSCRSKTDRSRSEGPQPHIIDLSFPKRVLVSVRLSLLDCNELQSHIQAISLFTSHPRDDSYTPSKISISAGTGIHDLHEVGSNSPPLPAYRRAKLPLILDFASLVSEGGRNTSKGGSAGCASSGLA
jgi:hypothetical protein